MDFLHGKAIAEIKEGDVTIELRGQNATLEAKMRKKTSLLKMGDYDEIIFTNPAHLLKTKTDILPSLSLIRHSKVKYFIDGVYAAVEEEVIKSGHDLSRTDFLRNLEALFKQGEAKDYLNQIINAPDSEISKYFERDPGLTLAQAHYDWTEEGRKIYREIKAASETPTFFSKGILDDTADKNIMKGILQIISGNTVLDGQYKALLELYSKMTNRFENTNALFPSSLLPDQEFFMRFSEQTRSDIEGGLAAALIDAIKNDKIDFSIKDDSGLYVWQIQEILPLVKRDTPEFKKWLPDENYQESMEKDFVSLVASTRHTHVAHTRHHITLIGSAAPLVVRRVYIKPDLRAEPLSTSYERMAASIDFLRKTVTAAFGDRILKRKRRLYDGALSEETIGEGFEFMNKLLTGLALISMDSVHMRYDLTQGDDDAIKTAYDWLENIADDPELDRNISIFVPIVRTTNGSLQIAYVLPGYKLADTKIEYKERPELSYFSIDGTKTIPYFDTVFEGISPSIPVLEHREIRIPYANLINDRKLRDLLGSTSEITVGEINAALEKLQ